MNLNLPKTVRSIRRVQTIAGVLSRHGFGHLVDRLRLERYVPLQRWRRPEAEVAAAELTLGQRLTRVLEELGPTFIKLGQVLSTRPDLLPADIVAELTHLQDKVPPFDTEIARAIITTDLGASIEECFEYFADTPFASGSIAQVYRARTRATADKKSCQVVVKVKRPDIADIVQLDMTILQWIAELAERLIPEMALYRPHLIVQEFRHTLLREMDFINEAATITRFSELFGENPQFHVPQVHWELTGPAVLTLEEIHGVSMQTLLDHPNKQVDYKAIARELAEAFLRQFFEIGLFHADPHPGNLLIEPPARIGLIDFGLTGRIDDEMMGHLAMALIGAFNREPDIIVQVLADMEALGDTTDQLQLRHDFAELIDKYYGLPLHRFDMQTLFYEVTGLIRRNAVTLPPDFILFGKALVTAGGIALQCDPDLNLLELVRPKIHRLMLERLAPGRLLKAASISGWHLVNILRNAPSQLRDISRRLASGRWQVNIRHQNLDDLAHEVDHASNRLSFAVIIAAIIMGSSWILGSNATMPYLNVPLPLLGLTGYVIAGLMGLWLVIAILRGGKLS